MSRSTRTSAHRDHWLSAGSGLSSCPYNLIFGKHEARVEILLQRPDADDNKQIFDFMLARKDEIEHAFGAQLTWKRLDEKISSRIEYARPFDGYNREHWSEIIAWMIEHFSGLRRHSGDCCSRPARQSEVRGAPPDGVALGGGSRGVGA